MGDHRQRRLLPAAPKKQSSESGLSEPEPLQKARGKGISRISTACEACKRRKSRCSGPPAPCTICSTQGTECVIDETLDHRRKTSAYQAPDGTTGDQQLLTALVQSIRFSELGDFQELVVAIRNNLSASEVAGILERNIRNLEDRGALWPVNLSELHAAVKSHSPESSTQGSNPQSGTRDTSPTTETSRTNSEILRPRILEKDSLRTGKTAQSFADQVKTYERWISLFGSRPDPIGDSRLERHPTETEGPKTRKIGLWRTVSDGGLPKLSSPVPETPQIGRARWHPALQIQAGPDEKVSEAAIELSHEEQAQFADLAVVLSTQEAEGWIETLRSIPDSFGTISEEHPHTELSYHLDFARYPLFSIQPIIAYEDSPLSRVVTDYLFAARNTLEQGVAPIQILGLDGIDVALLFRDRNQEDTYTVCDWASELWRSFHDWDIYVRLACCLSFTYIMRWLVVPTAKRYADVPDILRPLPIQRIKPHHAFIDLLPIPALREALVKNFRDFMTTLPAAQISVNWTGTMEHAVTKDEEFGCLRLTEAFEKHVIQSKNWSVGESILSTFPELKGNIRIDEGK